MYIKKRECNQAVLKEISWKPNLRHFSNIISLKSLKVKFCRIMLKKCPFCRQHAWYFNLGNVNTIPPDSFLCRHAKLSGVVWTPIPRYVTLHVRDRRGAASRRCRNRAEITVLLCKQKLSPVWLSCRRKAIRYRAFSRARFHSRGQYLLGKFIGTKESVCRRKEFNSLRIGLVHQHGRRFIVLRHPYGRRDVMWKHSIVWT